MQMRRQAALVATLMLATPTFAGERRAGLAVVAFDDGGAIRCGWSDRRARPFPGSAVARSPRAAGGSEKRDRSRRDDRLLSGGAGDADGYEFVLGSLGTHAMN